MPLPEDNFTNSNSPSEKPSGDRLMTHREKVTLSVIGGVGGMAILLAFLHLAVQIKTAIEPQNVKPPEEIGSAYQAEVDSLNAPDSSGIVDIAALKTKDTDGDGLSDYDELYVYKTSPYLTDTDSDGIPDNKEIQTGTDPNCPEGKTCDGSTQDLSNTNTDVPVFNAAPPPGSVTPLSSTDIEAQLRQAVPVDKLRQLLVTQGGLTQAQVDQLDDATINQIYEETLKSVTTQQTNTNTP